MAIDLRMGETAIKPLDWIKPYWRNPRRVPEEAVNAIVESVQRFGYQQPVVVDGEGIIIIGHTRYAALRKIGVIEAPVIIVTHLPADKVKQLRVIDNRVAEFTSWDLDALSAELSGFDESLRLAYFPDMAWEDVGVDRVAETAPIDTDPSMSWDNVKSEVEFVCPDCFHQFSVNVTRDDIYNGKIEVK